MKQHLKLLMVREGREVLGYKGANLWLLALVLVATFTSIAFSHGSMLYLKDKMEDPFTNWVSISKAVDNESFNAFRTALYEESNKEKYDYANVQLDQCTNYTFMGTDEGHIHYLSARFFQSIQTNLVKAILDESNIVEGCIVDSTLLSDKTFGFFITIDAAKRLGYSERNLPTYIQYVAPQDTYIADSLGIQLLMDDFYPISVPVLAVVRRLPNNFDVVSANFFYEQQHLNDHTHPFSVTSNASYLHQLHYYLSDGIQDDDITKNVRVCLPDSLKDDLCIYENENLRFLKPWKPGRMIDLSFGNTELSIALANQIADNLQKQYGNEKIRRVHLLETEEHPAARGEFISIEFKSLQHIRAFEAFAKEHGVQLDMAQVASKENFSAVTIMASVLSSAMVLFSLVCIIMFLVNMLQSYFQKVKHNIGTFKAFGMSAKELISVYTLILIMIVLSAVLLALLVTWTIQLLLPCLGIEKDGFNYLSLWNYMTYTATIVVVLATVATVSIVMRRMLSQTPGDLIYDRC